MIFDGVKKRTTSSRIKLMMPVFVVQGIAFGALFGGRKTNDPIDVSGGRAKNRRRVDRFWTPGFGP